MLECLELHLEQIKEHGCPVEQNFHLYGDQPMVEEKTNDAARMHVVTDKIFVIDSTFLADPNQCEHSGDLFLVPVKIVEIMGYFDALIKGLFIFPNVAVV